MAGITKVKVKRANGKIVYKYRITYRDIYGKQHTSPYYDTRALATKDLYKYEKINPNTLNLTIGQMFSVYMEYAKANYSFTTIADTESYINNHFYKLFEIKYDKITSIDLEQFINNIAKERSKHVANQALKKGKAVFGYCLKHGLIKENKFDPVSSLKVDDNTHFHLETNEIIEVLNCCQQKFPRHFAMIYTLIGTGARIGEVSALTKDDVHFEDDRAYIHVCKQFTKEKLIPHTKTNSIRDIEIFPDLAAVLKAHIESLPKDCELLFPNGAGSYQNPSNIRNRVWKPLLEEVGITKRVRLHDIRGSYIDLSLLNNLGVKFAQAQAGHKKSQTTLDVYARNNKDMNKKAMETLNDIFTKRNYNM